MFKKMSTLSAIAAASVLAVTASSGKVRGKTRDISYGYRMPAGYPGDCNRAHPFSIEPALVDSTAPPLLYGNAVLVNTTTNSVRQVAAGDTGITRIYGIVCRDYPMQQTTGGLNAALGSAVPPASNQALSIGRWGYYMARVNGSPTKNGAVYLWIAASSGNHVQGTFETVNTAGSTVLLANASFNGPADTNGVAEIILGFAPAA